MHFHLIIDLNKLIQTTSLFHLKVAHIIFQIVIRFPFGDSILKIKLQIKKPMGKKSKLLK